MANTGQGRQWLVLVYQFPQGPGGRRVKVWRRLQGIGAVALKNSVYVLPRTDQTLEDMQWLLGELTSSGAEAALLESSFIAGMTDQALRDRFSTARDADYRALTREIETTLESLRADVDTPVEARRGPARRAFTTLQNRFTAIEAIDFFGAAAHEEAQAALRLLDQLTAEREQVSEGEKTMSEQRPSELVQRTWVTRRGVRVDRIASAWLIRRWIDPAARFKFVDEKTYEHEEDELRFDMFEGEFTHEGDLCTFEVLARIADNDDAALASVGELVHDIDLKDSKFGRPETAGISSLLGGIIAGTDDDGQRIERGAALFEDLYRSFERA